MAMGVDYGKGTVCPLSTAGTVCLPMTVQIWWRMSVCETADEWGTLDGLKTVIQTAGMADLITTVSYTPATSAHMRKEEFKGIISSTSTSPAVLSKVQIKC